MTKPVIIKLNKQDVLILNRDYPMQSQLFLEFISENEGEYKVTKNDFDYTIEVRGSLPFLGAAMDYIHRNI